MKALLVMLFPLQFGIRSPLDVLSLPFQGLLFTSWYPTYIFILERVPDISVITHIGLNLFIGVMLALPAILFNYRLARSPANRRMRRLAAAALVLSGLMVFMVLLFISAAIIGSAGYYSHMIFQNILTFPTIAVGTFIVLPIIQRQAILIASPKEVHSCSPDELQKHPQSGVGREVTLSTILWASLYFLPFLLSPEYSFYYGQEFYVSSLACGVTIYFGGGIYPQVGPALIYGSIVPLFTLPSLCILSSLRFVFVRDIYRHLKHEMTYRRLLYLGFLADFFPVIAYVVIPRILFGGYILSSIVFPLPFLAVVGLLVTRLHRSVLRLPNRIWDDVEARMWFEEEEKRQDVAPVLEKAGRPEDETITVPLTYIMVSHIRRRRHNENSRRPDRE